MGQKLKIWATMTSIILLSGMLGFGFSPDVLATHNDKGESKAKGCENKNENGNTENNPHCGSEPLVSPCDNAPMDGVITVAELFAVPATAGEITTALASADLNNSTTIDSAEELAILITFSPFEVC